MPGNSNQTVYIGLAVTAAALVASYLLYTASQEADSGDAGSKDQDVRSKSPARSLKGSAETITPVASNTSKRGKENGGSTATNDKAIHAKIEELDKQGKKLFKEKKVRSWKTILLCLTTPTLPLLHFFFSFSRRPKLLPRPWI